MKSKPVSKRSSAVALTFHRLSDPGIWGWPLLTVAAILNLFLTLLMDVVRFNQFDWLWLVPSNGSLLAAIITAWVLTRFIKNAKSVSWFWLVNLLIGGISGAVKNTSVNLIAGWVGLATDDIWLFRILGGSFMGMAAVSFFAIATSARYEHKVAVEKLNGIQAKLLQQRKRLSAFVETENQKLISATKEVIVPRLRKIESMLTSSAGVTPLIEALRSTIEKDLRPLTKNITDARMSDAPEPEPHEVVQLRKVKLPKQTIVPRVLRPLRTFLFNSLAYDWFFVLFDGPFAIWLVLIACSIEALIQFVFMKTMADKPTSLRVALVKLLLIGLVAVLPTLTLVWTRHRDPVEYLLLSGMCLVISLGSLYSHAYAFVLDQERAKVEEAIERDNAQLSREISLYEQKIWVFRKSWQLVLHGTVQAALTAAVTRLSLNHDNEAVRNQLVAQDLKRAEDALQGNPIKDIDLHRSIAELSASWRGVCDVSVSVSERASRALKRNTQAMFCVNELMREAVSNAVRHGFAKRVQISLDRLDDINLDFSATNDGIPAPLNRIPGIGSKTFDELTEEWSIRTDQRSGQTAVRARIPIST